MICGVATLHGNGFYLSFLYQESLLGLTEFLLCCENILNLVSFSLVQVMTFFFVAHVFVIAVDIVLLLFLLLLL